MIVVPNSSNLNYSLLTGYGSVDSQGNTFVNPLGSTVSGYVHFLNNFTNYGTLTPGFSPGLVTIGGNYTEGGQVMLEILNNTPITGYDQIRVGGTVLFLPTSVFDISIASSALTPGATFQVIADSSGGQIPVAVLMEARQFCVDGQPANPDIISIRLSDWLFVKHRHPSFSSFPNPSTNPLFSLGSNPNEQNVARAFLQQPSPRQVRSTPVRLPVF